MTWELVFWGNNTFTRSYGCTSMFSAALWACTIYDIMLTNVSYMILWDREFANFRCCWELYYIIWYKFRGRQNGQLQLPIWNRKHYVIKTMQAYLDSNWPTFMIPGDFTLTNQLAAELIAPRKCHFLYHIWYHMRQRVNISK